ncbi:DUF2288 family protein [Aliikangiella maris]|uniref:DUF2288 family protein n=2 Tax=Aliikangiella maris TaxID=3162458 RepID=A0ABV2BQH3_9GAMM
MTDTDNLLPLKTKLNLETAKLKWKELELFFAKGNLLVVSTRRDLIEVAAQIAENKKDEIETLILNKDIEFAGPQWVKTNCQNNPDLWTVVVAPYVVCQLTKTVN